MRARIALLGWVLMALFPAPLAAHVDGMTLLVSPGTSPDQVQLDWSGGQPTFQIYRATAPMDLLTAVNLIGVSDVRQWFDTPGPGTIVFYEIASPCPYNPPEICDGQDNNCDGQIDEAGSEDSCADGDSCTVDACVGGACRNIDQRACPAAPTSGEGGVSCATLPLPAGCWGTSCSAEVIPLPSGCTSPDSDGDGLSDSWEDHGAIDFDCNGTYDSNDVALPGADKAVADVYLQASAMSNSPEETIPDLHRPAEEAVGRLVAMFGGSHLTTPPVRCDATAPCPEPGFACSTEDFVCLPTCQTDGDCAASTDGGRCVGGRCRRRRLHLSYAEINVIPHTPVLFFGPVVPECITGGDVAQGINFYEIKANPANFDPKEGLFKHYGVFGHYQSCDSATTCADPLCPAAEGSAPDHTRSGLAEVLGNDWMVTLGASPAPIGSEKVVRDAGAMAHELGHNLGLYHGGPGCPPGDPSCTYAPEQERKVNYLSVMNPWYQFGIPVTDSPGSTVPAAEVTLDYSHFALPPLDETNLDEFAGVSPGDPPPYDIYLIKYIDPVGQIRYGSTFPGMAIDWDFNGFLGIGVMGDLNQDGILEVHPGADDWGHLRYAFQCTPPYLD